MAYAMPLHLQRTEAWRTLFPLWKGIRLCGLRHENPEQLSGQAVSILRKMAGFLAGQAETLL